MPQVGLEPTTTVFERVKTVHALDRAATVIGPTYLYKAIKVRSRWARRVAHKKLRNTYKTLYLVNLKRRDHLGDLSVDGRIILKRIIT
jgi:hypothetical protein